MRVPPSERWEAFGTHLHRIEHPDLYFVRIRGDVLGDDMRTQIAALRALAKRSGGSVFWMADVTAMGTVTTDARRATAAHEFAAVRASLGGSAIIGASFTARVVSTLIMRAVRALEPHGIRPVAFVETEAEARAFLDPFRRPGADVAITP
ncbi:STAS/SEC14 domain-containing protein [Polyangium sp. 15x6]|uniref:STAS/SEC14 domain-containing protein n=1 Tax=Polyangium sp. 15x6 TaxID=3042687 RepID=UPI00249A256F|nr:STAS/SEC14 domain-containing protein [Polyangium sp. 15x6]MDI3288209.1 STAS/SEC14 domain-containing protein [Polyangium sp. 15x6]